MIKVSVRSPLLQGPQPVRNPIVLRHHIVPSVYRAARARCSLPSCAQLNSGKSKLRNLWACHHIAGSPACTKNTSVPMSRLRQIVYSDYRKSLFRLIVYISRLRNLNSRVVVEAYLASRGELQWAERRLKIGGVGLEVVQSLGDRGLKLRWALARWAVSRDLVHGAHFCDGCRWMDRESSRC